MLQNKINDEFNGIQVTNFHNRSTEPLNYRIYAWPQSIKQAKRPEFYKYTRLSVTRWITKTKNEQFERNVILTVYNYYVAIPYQGFVLKTTIFQFTFCGRQFIKNDQSRIINFIVHMNGIQVTNFHSRSPEPSNYRIYARPKSIKQPRRPEF